MLALAVVVLAGCVGPPVVRHRVQTVALPGAGGACGRELPVLVYVPPGYDDPARADERWPLVLHLHGILAEGSDPASVTREGLPRHLERGFSPPCIVASPQLWTFGQRFTPGIVLPVLDALLARYRVDPARVCVLGISSGASTGWEVVRAAPERFAGLVPIAGWSPTAGVERLQGVSVWGVYGALDFVAPPFVAARGVRAHRSVGRETRLTVVPTMSHWIPAGVYTSPALWAWMLAQRRTAAATRR